MEEQLEKLSKISKEVLKFSKSKTEIGVSFFELATSIEAKIKELGAELGCPVTISANDIAAHDSPFADDKRVLKEGDVVKVDHGIKLGNLLSDFAFTKELGSNKYSKLIETSEEALQNAIKTVKAGVNVKEIGEAIENTIRDNGFVPVRNLSGHSLDPEFFHGDIQIPNIKGGDHVLKEGDAIAIEPFVTDGAGWVVDSGRPSIFSLIEERKVRLGSSRELIKFVSSHFGHLPFSIRWLPQTVTLNLNLADLVRQEVLHAYPPLRDKDRGMVAQTESCGIVRKDGFELIV